MKVVVITGSGGSDRTRLVERLVDRLHGRGRVATVTHPSLPGGIADGETRESLRTGDATATYRLTDTGWSVSGERPSLDEILEHLAPTYDFTVLVGFDDVDFLRISPGESDAETDGDPGEGVVVVETGETLTLDDVVERLAESDPFETLASLVSRAKASSEAEKAGAIATFTGRVRAKEHDDDVVTERLEFERHDERAAERFAAIREDLEARDGVFEVLMHHRTGVVEYGEDIVFVVVLAGHREQAFRAVEDGINRLKAEVPLFKKEVTVEEEFWAHEQDGRAKRGRRTSERGGTTRE